ncbi:MAG: cation transporter [Burkholderiales bacterium]|nr:cation transporter [Burkholderiales bacterium]
MTSSCCSDGCSAEPAALSPRYARILWIALALNAVMFAVEIVAGLHAGSVSLLADAIDFFGDAANYGISIAVLSMGLIWRARAALIKGLTMGAYGLFVLGKTGWSAFAGVVPEPMIMGVVGGIALGVNVLVAVLLYTYRSGDANMRSVWLCSRNDAIGNIAVVLAAIGVAYTATGWPDLAVASIMGVLSLTAARSVVTQARGELAASPRPSSSVSAGG